MLNEWIHNSPLNGIFLRQLYKKNSKNYKSKLQKPSKNFKSKDHQLAFEHRLELSHKEFEELYSEDETSQASLKTIQKPSSITKILKTFKQHITKGSVIQH